MAAATELPLAPSGSTVTTSSKFFMKVMGKARKEDIAFGNSTRVYAYGLYQESGEPVYVHSKLMIIDDRYVAVGSANFDSRSMFVDTELTVGIVDGDIIDSILDDEQAKVCKFAARSAEQLWAEHLGFRSDPLEEPRSHTSTATVSAGFEARIRALSGLAARPGGGQASADSPYPVLRECAGEELAHECHPAPP